MSHPVFAHTGPWTEAAYLALPEDAAAARMELLDGSLLIGPAPDDTHHAMVDRMRVAVEAALPEGLRVTGPVALRVAAGRILRPDLVVLTGPAEPTGPEPLDPARVVQVLVVAGPDNALADRWLGPQLYAEADIPYYLRVEYAQSIAVACRLIGGRYLEHVRTGPGEPLRLDDPFPVTIELAEAASAEAAVTAE